jgi:hypothetical protein
VYLLLQGKSGQTFGAHPVRINFCQSDVSHLSNCLLVQIHLHGHDFAILAVSSSPYPAGPPLNLDNPPRRDVVLLPNGGWVMMAFKTDNPGPWIMHCHIAQHASFGLALQILERQSAAYQNVLQSGALAQAKSTCKKWNAWWSNCYNWWYDVSAGQKPGHYCQYGENWFSPDSGI